MSLIPYKYFVYLNYAIAAILTLLPWFIGDKTSAKLVISGIGLATLLVLGLSKEKPFPKLQLIPVRAVILSVFILMVFLSFSHYLLNFSEENGLVTLIYSSSMLTLLSLVFTSLNKPTEKTK